MGARYRYDRSLDNYTVFSQSATGSDILYANFLGAQFIILNSMQAANDLLERRSSIYSDRYVESVVVKQTFNDGIVRPIMAMVTDSDLSVFNFLLFDSLTLCQAEL